MAALLAGAAFNAASVTLGHALAQTLGARLNVPHAVAVAVATPVALRFNLPSCTEPYAQLARVCGLSADTPEALAARFVEHVIELLRRAELPTRLPRPIDAPADLAERLVQEVVQSCRPLLTLNPRRPDVTVLRELIEALLD